jgi:hypothetical protein
MRIGGPWTHSIDNPSPGILALESQKWEGVANAGSWKVPG